MAGLLDILNGSEEGGEDKLDSRERQEFDEITYDKIQSICDPKKLARLEAYMRREEFFTTADVARARLHSLTSSAPRQEAPTIWPRKSGDSELDQVLRELKTWEASVKGADKALKQDTTGPSQEEAAPIRRQVGGKVDKAGLIEEPENVKPKNAKQVVEKAKRLKDPKDVRSGAEYYKKWNKVADQLEEDEEGPTKRNEETPVEGPKEDEDRSSATTLSAAAANRLVEAAWKKPAVEREWLATREREKGNELFKSQEYRSSLASYTLAIRLQPTSAAAYANRAAAHLKLKQYKEACADCDKALEIDPHYLKAQRRRGAARLELGQYEGAVADLEAAQKLDSESKEVSDLLRKARSKLDKTKPMKRMQIEEVDGEDEAAGKGKEEADKGKSLGNEGPIGGTPDESVRRNKSVGQSSDAEDGHRGADKKKGESAEKDQGAADKLGAEKGDQAQKEADVNNLADGWREKGNSLYKRGDTAGAAACYTHSLTYSRTAAALSNRAMCWNKMGKYREGEADASAALALDGNFVKAHHRRAAARRGLDKKQAAMEDYKVVLQALPTNAALQDEVRSLQEEMEETMYIPPRKGAMVIEEVAEEPQPAVNPALSSSKDESLHKPAAFAEQKQEKQSLDGAGASPENAQRDANGNGKAAHSSIEDSEEAFVKAQDRGAEGAGENEAGSKESAQKGMESAPSEKPVLATDPSFQPFERRSEPSIAGSDGQEEAEKDKEEGNRLFKQKNIAEALKHYTRAIELQPRNAAFYGNRAMCFLQLKKYADAVSDASKALELDPQYTKAYYRRALAKKALGRYESALEDLQAVQEKMPKDKQVAEELLAVTDLYMRRLENLAAPSVSEQGAPHPAKSTPPQASIQQPLAEEPAETKEEAISGPSRKGLPAWLKEQLEAQVKHGDLKGTSASTGSTPLDSEEFRKEPEKPAVQASGGSLTDDVFEGTFGSKQDRPAFSVGSFDKKASPSKTSPRGKRRASPRSVVSSIAQSETPSDEIEEEGSPSQRKGSLEEQEPPTKKQPRVLLSKGAHVENGAEEKPQDLPSTTKNEGAEKPMPAAPRSALDFERACSSLREPERIAAYLETLDPSSFPSIIKENLSALLMTHIAKALPLLPPKTAADLMGGLADVSRFGLVWMLLPVATKKSFAAVVGRLTPDQDASPQALERLRRAFRA